MGRKGTANKYHWCVWGVLAMFRPHCICPHSRHVCYTRLHCSGSRLLYREWALSCVHFPGLNRSGSDFWVLHKGIDSSGPVFCVFPVREAQAARSLMSTLSSGAVHLIPSPSLASISRCARSYALYVSSGELISGGNPPSGCQPSRISGSLWLETESLFEIW